MSPRAALARLDPRALMPWACVAGGTAWLSALAVRLPAGDGDRLWQRWLGDRILREHALPRTLGTETFAAPGAPWTPHEWLFSIALAATSARGVAWIVGLVCALAAGAALVAVVLRCRARGVSPPLASAAVLLGVIATMQSFGVRAQVLGWAGLAWMLWLLEIDGPAAWAAVPLTVAWANLHASAVLAPGIAALVAGASAMRDRSWSADVRRKAAIAASCAVATLATPLGWDLPRYAVALVGSPIRHSISEWGATSLGSVTFEIAALPLLLVLAAFGVRASLRDRIVAIAFSVLLFTAVRNVPVFVLAVAPIACAAIPLRRALPATRDGAARGLAWTTAAAVLLGSGSLAAYAWRAAPEMASPLPLAAARALIAQAHTPPRVFCEDFAWCSLFLADGVAARLFMDGRCDPYPPEVWREYRVVLDGNRGWSGILDRRRVDAVMVRRDSALDSLLAERPGEWRTIASDARTRVYVRPALIAHSRGSMRGVE